MSGPARPLLAVLLALCLYAPSFAVDYEAPSLVYVLGTADAAILTGRGENPVEDVVVVVEEVIRGDGLHASESIRIIGAGKWYAETPLVSVKDYDGEILFLIREAETDAWRIVGPLGAGRMLLRDGYAYLGGFQTKIPRVQYRRNEPPLQRLLLADLLRADLDIRKCLRWRKDSDNARPKLVCSVTELQSLKKYSELHRVLVDEAVAEFEREHQ